MSKQESTLRDSCSLCSFAHRMPSYSLRIDGALQAVLAWIAHHAIGGWGVREVSGDNEHWHFHLHTDKTIKQLRCSFNREVPDLKGNGKYSLTECRDGGKYDRYMAKGDSDGQYPEVVWKHGVEYTDEWFEEQHDLYWEENRKLKKRKIGSMIDWVVDECKRQNVEWSNRKKISEIYIRELGARSKPINLHAVRANVNSVQYQLCGNEECLSALVDRCEQW